MGNRQSQMGNRQLQREGHQQDRPAGKTPVGDSGDCSAIKSTGTIGKHPWTKPGIAILRVWQTGGGSYTLNFESAGYSPPS